MIGCYHNDEGNAMRTVFEFKVLVDDETNRVDVVMIDEDETPEESVLASRTFDADTPGHEMVRWSGEMIAMAIAEIG